MSNSYTPASSFLVELTWSGGSGKSAWQEIIASTTDAWDGFNFYACPTLDNDDIFVDIATGGVGVETVVVSNILIQMGEYTGLGDIFGDQFQKSIASGTRISMRFRSSGGNSANTVRVGITQAQNLSASNTDVETYGVDSEESVTGATISASATAGTYGAWAQVEASTAQNADQLIVMISSGNNTAQNNSAHALDLAIGGSGSEDPQVERIYMDGKSSENPLIGFYRVWLDSQIPSGTEFRARLVSTESNASVDVVILGFYGSAGGAVTGTFSANLPLVELSGSGLRESTGDFGSDLPLMQMDSSGNVEHTGELSADLPIIELDSSGNVEHTGSFSSNVPLIEMLASGTVGSTTVGNFSADLPIVLMTSEGKTVHVGQIAGVLPLMEMSSIGAVDGAIAGSFEGTLPVVVLDASGNVVHSGELNATIPLMELLSSGFIEHIGSFDGNLPLMEMNASGSVGSTIVGSLVGNLPLPAMSAQGIIEHTGSLNAQLPLITLSAVGNAITSIDGSLSSALPLIQLDATGAVGSIFREVIEIKSVITRELIIKSRIDEP